MIEIQKERIGLAKYITGLSLGVSAGIYIFIGATIRGVVATNTSGVTLTDTLRSFLDANPLTVMLIFALATFLIAIVIGVSVISNHIKNWGNVDQSYGRRERFMMGFASSGVLSLLMYLLVISWNVTIVAIETYGQIALTGFLVICLLAGLIYTIFLFIRMVGESLVVLGEIFGLFYKLAKFIAQALIKKFRP